MNPHVSQSLLILGMTGLQALYSVNVSGKVSKKLSISPFYAITALVIFSLMHYVFWVGPWNFLYLLMVPSSLAFLYGVLLLSTGVVTLDGEDLRLNENSILYKVPDKVFDFFALQKPSTLCGLSWASVLLLLLFPLIIIVLICFMLFCSIFVFLVFGRNPILWLIDSYKKEEMRHCDFGKVFKIPVSPGLWACLASPFFLFPGFWKEVSILYVFMVIVGFSFLSLLLFKTLLFFSDKTIESIDVESERGLMSEHPSEAVRDLAETRRYCSEVRRDRGYSGIRRIHAAFVILWASFKKSHCQVVK